MLFYLIPLLLIGLVFIAMVLTASAACSKLVCFSLLGACLGVIPVKLAVKYEWTKGQQGSEQTQEGLPQCNFAYDQREQDGCNVHYE